MPKGVMVVQTSPEDPTRDDEYNDWYSNTHVPEVLAIPGFVSARRYRVHQPGRETVNRYLSIYEVEADDLTAPMQELRMRSAAGEMTKTDTVRIDPPAVVTLYELIE